MGRPLGEKKEGDGGEGEGVNMVHLHGTLETAIVKPSTAHTD